VSWTVRNTGLLDASGGWSDGVYLSEDPLLDAADTQLNWLYHSASLTPEGSYDAAMRVTVPSWQRVGGTHYLLFVADRDARLAEMDETNNVRAVPMELSGPDLAATEASASASSASPGENVRVRFTIVNRGTVATKTNYWWDAV